MSNTNFLNVEFLGDLSLDGLYNDPQHFFGLSENMQWISKLNSDVDYRVINWESQLWGDGQVNELKYPRLCATKAAAESILPLNIDLALIANNHVFDNQLKGFNNTIDFFNNNNISYIGATIEQVDFNKPHILSKNGIKIGFINNVGLETNPNLPKDCPVLLNVINEEVLLSQTSILKKDVDHVVVNLHWGDTEYVRSPNVKQRSLARKLIDNGASAVVGHHVHCLQGYEEYNDGLICYSLGNFIFSPQLVVPGKIDSYRMTDNNMAALLKISFTKTNFTYDWKYLIKEKNDMYLKSDDGRAKKMHLKTNKYLSYSDSNLNRKYKLEILISPIRNFIDKNGGIIKAVFSVKVKQLYILKKILFNK